MLTEHLNPYLPQIAESLLEISAIRLSERHSARTAWGQSESTWDSDSISRSAIEPHSQDQFQNDVDALIDVARECLDWLATSRTEYARLWSERHSISSSAAVAPVSDSYPDRTNRPVGGRKSRLAAGTAAT